MGAVVGGELHLLDRPALPVRQILRLQPFEELQHARQALLVVDVLDRGVASWRIGGHVVLQRYRDINQSSGHSCFLGDFCCFLSMSQASHALARDSFMTCNSLLRRLHICYTIPCPQLLIMTT